MSNQNNTPQKQDQLSFSFNDSKDNQDNSYSYFQFDQDSIQKKPIVNHQSIGIANHPTLKTGNPHSIRKPNTHQIIYKNVYGYYSQSQLYFQKVKNRQKQLLLNKKVQKNKQYAHINEQIQESQLSQCSIDSQFNGCQYYQNLYRKGKENLQTYQKNKQSIYVNYTPLLKQLQNDLKSQIKQNQTDQFSKDKHKKVQQKQLYDFQASEDSLEMSQINYYETIYDKQLKRINLQNIQRKLANQNAKKSQNQYNFKKNTKIQKRVNDGKSIQKDLTLSLSIIKNKRQQKKQKTQFNKERMATDKLTQSDLSIIKLLTQTQKYNKNSDLEHNLQIKQQNPSYSNKYKRGNTFFNSRGKMQEFQNMSSMNQSKLAKFNIDILNQRHSKFQQDIIHSIKQQQKNKKQQDTNKRRQFNYNQDQINLQRQMQSLNNKQFEGKQARKKYKIYIEKLKNQKVPQQIMNNLKKYSKFDLPKHHAIYYIYSTPIIVIKQAFNFLEADILVVPYRQFFSQNEIKIQDSAILKYLNKYLSYDLTSTLKKYEKKKELSQSSILKFEALGIKNLKSFYMLKMSTTNLENHASKILQQGVKKIFSSIIDSTRQNLFKTIIFPAVNYHGIKRQNVGQNLLPQILKCLAQTRHKYQGKILLKQIIISVAKPEQYLQYLRVMEILMAQYRKIFPC